MQNIPSVQKLPEFPENLVPLYHPVQEFNPALKSHDLKNVMSYLVYLSVKYARPLTGCPFGPWSPCDPGSPIPPLKPLFPGGPFCPRRPCSPWMDGWRNGQMMKWGSLSGILSKHYQPFYLYTVRIVDQNVHASYLWSDAPLVSWEPYNASFTTWASFARKTKLPVITMLALKKHIEKSGW